jgi:outer membrane protein TolC
VVRFPAAGISLEEAARRTLENDASIQRADASASFQQGVAQQQTGIFDTVFFGSAEYTWRAQELSESAKEEQRKKRAELDDLILSGPSNIAFAKQGRDLIQQVKNNQISSQELTKTSPTLAATLITLDELIRTSSPQQAALLNSTRQQVLDNALRIANEELAAQETIFASATEERQNIGEAPIDEYFKDATMNVQLSKLYRTGITLTPFLDGAFNSTGFRGKPHDVRFGGKGLTDLYTFRAGVSSVVPLARGRGADAVAAPERAARIDHDASLLALEHQRSASVLNTVQAYWSLRAAQETAAIAAQSLQFQQQLVALTRMLVTTGDLPGVELTRAQATEARARADEEDARRRLKDARVELAVSMGVTATDDDATLPLAADPFPESPSGAPPTSPLIDQALQQRQDLGADTKFQESSDVLVTAARVNLRPLLDLGLGTWYTALDEGTLGKSVDRWVGPSASTSVQFEKPLGNNALRGELVQREASARLRQIDRADLARRIQLGVVQASSTLQDSIGRVQQALAAVNFYQSTIDAEMARLRNGDATVLDTIVTQQQQTGAQLNLVAARLELAQRIGRLRFETGTMVTGGAVSGQTLVTVPTGAR